VKGHDFSRADKVNRMIRALAPAKLSDAEALLVQSFPNS
jgi:hypothetical protein